MQVVMVQYFEKDVVVAKETLEKIPENSYLQEQMADNLSFEAVVWVQEKRVNCIPEGMLI